MNKEPTKLRDLIQADDEVAVEATGGTYTIEETITDRITTESIRFDATAEEAQASVDKARSLYEMRRKCYEESIQCAIDVDGLLDKTSIGSRDTARAIAFRIGDSAKKAGITIDVMKMIVDTFNQRNQGEDNWA